MEYIISEIRNWIDESVFFYPLLLSLFSAIIFYFFFSVLPQKRQRKNIKDHVIYLIERILFHIMFIIQDSVNKNIDQFTIRSKDLTSVQLKEATIGVDLNQYVKNTRMNKEGRPTKVAEAVVGHIQENNRLSELIFRYIIHLDTKLVEIINEALRNSMNESLTNYYKSNMARVRDETQSNVKRDMSIYSDHLYRYHITYRKLENWLFKKYPNHKHVLRRKYFHFFSDKLELKKGIKIAAKLQKYEDYQKEAVIFLIKGYAVTDKLKKAKKIAKKYIEKGLIDFNDIEITFKYDDKHKDFDLEKLK